MKTPLQLVKGFVAKRRLNYTALLSRRHNTPNPYNTVNAIPSSFFIDSEGKTKLATVGMLSSPEAKSILKAEQQWATKLIPHIGPSLNRPTRFVQPPPSVPVPWGLAVDRDGRVVVSLDNGKVLCYGRSG